MEKYPEDAFLYGANLEELMEQAAPVPILAGITEKEGYMIYGNFLSICISF